MHSKNYFVKLLMFSMEDDFLLLYGFCSATSQETYAWKQEKVSKTKQSIWKAILTEDECNYFLDKLTQSGVITLGETSFTSPQLFKRAIVLSNDGVNEKEGPIDKYRQLTEFWNTNKMDLFHEVMKSMGTDGRELYEDIKKLLDWMLQECGIKFFKNAHRFGNFEFYHSTIHENNFIVESHKEYALLKTTVTKRCEYNKRLIVNCVSEHRERTICNQTKIFLPEEQCLEFVAEEPMSKVVIQIWDEESGKLLFSYNGTLLMGVCIGMNMGSSSYRVRDPWSHSLFKAASNRSEFIEKYIETISHTRKYDYITIESEFSNEIDSAIKESRKLFPNYAQSKIKGAFIEKVQKDGEMQSFLKIREYIEESSVKQVIIVDPYFSIDAVAKILTRISRRDIQIEVITSLSNTNPDTGEVADMNESKRLQEFLRQHTTVLHPHLLVCNLKRGERQVFHDRYLLRYFEDGRIDGFLLSNSLNSMGQFYPFVIAPMEYEVCLEVISYLEFMRDDVVQSTVNKKERITCEVLYDSKKKEQLYQQDAKEDFFSTNWLNKWCNSTQELQIPEQDILEAVTIVMKRWSEDEKLACRTLCSISLSVFSYLSHKVTETVQKVDGLADLFIDSFSSLAKEKEVLCNHMTKGIESTEYKLWELLNGMAQPSRSGFSQLIKYSGHIWYDTDGWLRSGYTLLFDLDTECYMKLLESTKSPMMFDVLMTKLLYYNWPKEVFYCIVEKGNLYIQLICADCIFEKLKMNYLSIEESKAIFMQIYPEKRLIQMIRLLSEGTFYVRVILKEKKENERELWNDFCDWLLNVIASDIINCTQETQETAIYWLNDCEIVSNCNLHFNLASRVSDYSIKNKLLDNAIDKLQNELCNCNYERDMENHILSYVKGIEARYGQDSEKEILKRGIDWSAFETAAEPELKNYAYEKWHKAYIKAKRQLQFLQIYVEMHPNSVKAKKYIEIWEKRIE